MVTATGHLAAGHDHTKQSTLKSFKYNLLRNLWEQSGDACALDSRHTNMIIRVGDVCDMSGHYYNRRQSMQ